MSFAGKLRHARISRQYSQEMLAEKMDVSRQTITKWESVAGFPEMKKAIQLASVLHVSLDWLFSDELKAFGWKTLAEDYYSFMSEEEQMAQQIVNEQTVKRAVEGLYNPTTTGAMQTGIECIDSIDGGIRRGNIYFVYGAPESGKLYLAENIALNFLRDGRSVLFILKEHTMQRIVRETLCVEANVCNFTGHEEYSDTETEHVEMAAKLIQNGKLSINDTYDETVEKLYENCLSSNQQIDLIVVDSARLMRSALDSNNIDEAGSRVSTILRMLARECRCAMLVLNRTPEAVENMLKMHQKPESIVDEFIKLNSWSERSNLWFTYREDYYHYAENDESIVQFIYQDSWRGKSVDSASYKLSIRTGKIL